MLGKDFSLQSRAPITGYLWAESGRYETPSSSTIPFSLPFPHTSDSPLPPSLLPVIYRQTHTNSPYDQTSDLLLNFACVMTSGAAHLMGNLVPSDAVYSSSMTNLASPKSATFTMFRSPIKQLRAACTTHRHNVSKTSYLNVYKVTTHGDMSGVQQQVYQHTPQPN